jgi:hypothetical protein
LHDPLGGGGSNEHGTHFDQVTQQFKRRALLGRGPVIKFVPIDLSCQVK